MSARPPNSTLALPLAGASMVRPRDRSELEMIVIHLFDQLQPRLSSYVAAFGLPQHDAEDIVQETFLSLFRHLNLGRPQSNLHGWLFRVAHNLALKRQLANRAGERTVDHEKLLADQRAPGQDAEEQIVFHQTQRCLQAIFEVLPIQDQQCLRLRAEGLKYREIARIVGISLGAVSVSLSRSLAKMQRAAGGK